MRGSSLLVFFNRLRFGRPAPVEGPLYAFTMRSIDGKPVSLSAYRGKNVLVVNTASRCGFTPQLGELERLYRQFRPRLEILAFPSNDFLWQEPGSNPEIESFCRVNYGVSFPLFEKISVSGRNAHPLFRYLAGATGSFPTWNFCKYLIDETGQSVLFFDSKTEPFDSRITNRLGEHI